MCVREKKMCWNGVIRLVELWLQDFHELHKRGRGGEVTWAARHIGLKVLYRLSSPSGVQCLMLGVEPDHLVLEHLQAYNSGDRVPEKEGIVSTVIENWESGATWTQETPGARHCTKTWIRWCLVILRLSVLKLI